MTPHVLKDGADSVGLLGALNRVYLNIGLFSEEWLLHFNPVVGGKEITPIRIADAQKNSPYWQATEAGTPATALFFLKAAQPDRLKDAPGGMALLNADAATLDRGKIVFADTCARCHSSKGPAPPAGNARAPRRPVRWRRLPRVLQALLELDPDRRVQEEHARRRDGARLPARQLPVDRSPHPVDAAAHQHLQSAGHQRARGQHLGQLLVAVVQGAAVGGDGHRQRSVHRPADAVLDARGRPRLRARAIADQRLVRRRRCC